jgi:hypothetical protein
MMNETPVLYNASEFLDNNLGNTGTTLGIKVALKLSVLYILGFYLLIAVLALFDPTTIFDGNLRDGERVLESIVTGYTSLIVMGTLMLVVGGFPAAIIGAIGGGFIGYTYGFFKTKLCPNHAIAYGFLISLILLVIRIFLPYLLLTDVLYGQLPLTEALQRHLVDFGWWIFWYTPNLIAFFGFWWVAYQLNEKMPTLS